MNKSKFLKRSLAALLAILMVATMIPSAFAATTEPDVIKVQNVAVEFSGDSATVSITAPNGTASVIENALKNVTFELRSKNGTSVGILDKDGKQKTVDLTGWPDAPGTKQTINLLSYAVKPEGTYWGDYTGIKLRIIPKSGDPVDYPLTISVSERSASSNTGIDSIESTRIVGARIEGRNITIIKPVGADSDYDTLGLKKENFNLSGAGATVDFTLGGTSNKVITNVTVTAEDKSTRIYDVHYEIEPIFESFTLEGIEIVSYTETEDDINTDEYNGNGKKTITIKVPFGAYEKALVPAFTPSESIIEMKSKTATAISFSHGDGILYKRDEGTTSGVAVWADSTGNRIDNTENTHPQARKFLFDVQTNVSSLKHDTTTYDAKGEVTVVFMPVENNKAELTGVNVGDKDGANTYTQGIAKITAPDSSVIVGEIPDENLEDVDDVDAGADVVQLTRRDVELKVSTNAEVTILNPDGLVEGDSSIISDDTDGTDTDGGTPANNGTVPGTLYAVSGKGSTRYPDSNGATTGFGGMPKKKTGATSSAVIADHDGTVVFNDVNLRKYHNTPMRILVTSEDGSTNTEYRINFNGTPEGKPEVKKVVLHGASNGDVPFTVVESTQDKKGNIIIHLPYKAFGNTNPTLADLRDTYDTITVEASGGATVASWSGEGGGTRLTHLASITEGTLFTSKYTYLSKGAASADTDFPGLTDIYEDANFYAELHANYDPDVADTAINCGDPTADDFPETVTPVFIYVDDPSTTADITEITLTEKKELYQVANNEEAQITGVIDHSKKTIRLDVPYSFNRKADGTTIGTGTDLYLYDWEFNGVDASDKTKSTPAGLNTLEYDLARLGEQTGVTATQHTQHEAIVNLQESEITTLAKAGSFTPAKSVRNVIDVFNEKASTTILQSYTVYAVRRNANDESKLNNVGATAPVSAVLDTKVPALNRYIITIPENYDSATGINSAPEFELSFADRSENSTVMNGQTTWVARGENTAKFKVVNGKLYFKNQPANLTDGRVIHFTVVAEDGTSTGAYEFEIRTTEPNNDATVSSVMVDDTLIFTQEGNNFVVKNLEDDENYDETKLPIIVNTTDPAATVTVDGKEYRFEWGVGSNITVDLSEGKTVPMVVTAADGKTTANYTLSMASSTVTPPDPWTNPFTDVKEGDWYYNAVKYVNQNGLMDGTSATKFSPRVNLTRAQFAQILYNAEGNPDVTWTDKFSDVKEGAWYANAVIWAAENNVLAGYANGTARPNSIVTREDLVSLLWRYAGKPAPTGTTLDFSDASKVSSYAKDALLWAVENKIISGRANGELDPKGNAQRAEAAQMLMQYFSNK